MRRSIQFAIRLTDKWWGKLIAAVAISYVLLGLFTAVDYLSDIRAVRLVVKYSIFTIAGIVAAFLLFGFVCVAWKRAVQYWPLTIVTVLVGGFIGGATGALVGLCAPALLFLVIDSQ